MSEKTSQEYLFTVDQTDPKLEKVYIDFAKQDQSEIYQNLKCANKLDLSDWASEKAPLDLVRLVQSRIDDVMDFPLSDFDRGRIAFVRKTFDESRSFFDESIYYLPKNIYNIRYYRALMAIEEGNFRALLTELQELKKGIPSSNPYIQYLDGEKYRFFGNSEIAADNFTAAITNNVREAIYALGRLYIEEKEFEEAKKAFLAGIKKDDALSYYGMGVAFEAEKDYRAAALFYDIAQKLNVKEAWVGFIKCKAWAERQESKSSINKKK